MKGELVRYDEMCRAIDAAYRVDEVKDIRDKAKAIEVYSKQAKNFEAERRACEIRLRAEKKAGVLLAQVEKAKGTKLAGRDKFGSPKKEGPKDTKTLAQHGISHKQSSEWQRLAKVPDDLFEKHIATGAKSARQIIDYTLPKKEANPPDDALWLWGRLKDFERNGTLKKDPDKLLAGMTTKAMREDTLRLAPIVSTFLRRIGK